MSLKSPTLKQQIELMRYALPRDLGNDLILRVATRDDAEPLAQMVGRVFGRENFDANVAAYARHYTDETHPIIGPSNVLIVEDTRVDKIVSTMCLIPQTWTYAGIPFPVGRPEVVATDPEYRNRGLVREQFKTLHALSDAMGHLVQGITGIHWYYRQFEYEYAFDLGGGRVCHFSNVPALKEGEADPYRVRAMTPDDIPFIAPLYDRACARSLVTCPRPESLWRYFLDDSPLARAYRLPFQIIETTDGRVVGYVDCSHDIWQDVIVVGEIAAAEGQSLRALTPTVLRWLKAHGETESAQQNKPVNAVYFALGREHPLFDAIPELLPRTRLPYGWYIRVPDVPRLLRHLAPALEDRLARSAMAGHSGALKISEYRRGYKIVFENGKIANAETWQPTVDERGDCGFPPLVFLQLLFGRATIMELREFFPDVWANDEPTILLDALFPKQASCVCAVG
ncbi:MAG: GNAT family N-acetyltransferase [Chloroflexi bacterium]|nr:GNAT family N-acetyltransferase [Chloroflexota bacterium]